ncbi:PhzF family isomerase [Desulfopila sp. IMCC35008]|uniref:PhzF family isomerase n=1 Tax=Desulfopila sp. IMCC35008 TaxID=2653858 RepID=UPI0013D5252E|nr:PhzF family isomerase [Desulfopila sp. IMCC35008]
MKKYILYQIDAFTKRRFKGNPAGVVVNSDGLSDSQMQTIARELNNSETAFLFMPDGSDCDGVIRYFTPSVEVPICGHATIAAMYAKTVEESLDSYTVQMKTGVGVLPFEIQRQGDEIKVWMTQGPFQISAPLSPEVTEDMLQYLGLYPDDLTPECPIQIASTGHSKVMICIKSRETLNRLTPDMTQLAQLSNRIQCNGFFVFTLDSNVPGTFSFGRMFAPAIGINEDPVTGNANGPLGGYLVHNNLVDTHVDTFSFHGKQGEAIGREGTVEVLVEIENHKTKLVKIAGEAVTVFKTSIDL